MTFVGREGKVLRKALNHKQVTDPRMSLRSVVLSPGYSPRLPGSLLSISFPGTHLKNHIQ